MAVGDPATEAQARFILDWAYVSLGQADRAVHSARALEIYAELGDLAGQAGVLNNLGGFAYFDGRWDEAIELYERLARAAGTDGQRGRRGRRPLQHR